jgi:uncharacterized tellurite resistance protein B-like protein
MSDNIDSRAFNVCLGKLLIAAAWSDGQVNREELNCLKSLILQMPNITFDDWRKLKIYLAYPISTLEQDSIVREFVSKVYNGKHRKRALQAIITIIEADGSITIEEKSFAKEINSAINKDSSGLLRKIKFFLFKSSILSEKGWQNNSGRDRMIHEFFDNPIYFVFRKAILKEKLAIPHSKPSLQRICLFSGILCWFAQIEDGNICLEEEQKILEILMTRCELDKHLANCILKVASKVDVSEMHLSELVGSLHESSTKDDCEEFFEDVVNMVILDGDLSIKELECVRTVALYLKIDSSSWYQAIGNIGIKLATA